MNIMFSGSGYNNRKIAYLSASAHWGERDHDDWVGVL